MKTFLIGILLMCGFSGIYAQDIYVRFKKDIQKMDAQEQAYRTIIWGKNDYSKSHKDSIVELYKAIRKEKLDFARKAIGENRSDKRFIEVLGVYVQNYLSMDELENELKQFSPEVQKVPEWQKKMDFVKYSRLNAPGQPCIDFTVKGHDGKEIRLSEVLKKNKLVLVDFWASWCGPCRASMPHLKEIYPEYKKKGVEFFSVSLDDKQDAWKKGYEELALPWVDGSNLLGWSDPIAKQYAIAGIPFKMLIGQDGVIVDKGFHQQGSLEKAMDDYLNGLK